MTAVDSIGGRIREILVRFNITQGDLGDMIDLSRTSMSKLVLGKGEPSYDTLQKILNSFPNISARWLLRGEGDMLDDPTLELNLDRIKGSQAKRVRELSGMSIDDFSKELGVAFKTVYNNESLKYVSKDYQTKITAFMDKYDIEVDGTLKENQTASEPKGKYVPLYNISAAASPELNVYDDANHIVGYMFISGMTEESDGAIEVAGNSMSPKYPPGTRIALKRIKEFNLVFEPGKPYVIETEEQRLFKYLRIDESNPDNFIGVSENKNYQDMVIPKSAIKRLWKVIARATADSMG